MKNLGWEIETLGGEFKKEFPKEKNELENLRTQGHKKTQAHAFVPVGLRPPKTSNS